MKRLKKGHSPVLVDAGGYPRDATGHRTDLKPRYSRRGERLWYAEELTFGLSERVRASTAWHRMTLGECGTIMIVPEFTQREYLVLAGPLHPRLPQKTQRNLPLPDAGALLGTGVIELTRVAKHTL